MGLLKLVMGRKSLILNVDCYTGKFFVKAGILGSANCSLKANNVMRSLSSTIQKPFNETGEKKKCMV